MGSINQRARGRSRNWATIVYPESAPDNFIAILREKKITALVSPLHSEDLNADGEIKKAHFHILFKFPSVKSCEQFTEIKECINGVGVERIADFRAYARYLCHLDNPEKFQYDIHDVVEIGNINYLQVSQSISDKYLYISDMLKFIEKYDIISFSQFFRICAKYKPEWFNLLCDSSTYIIKEYLTSRQWESNNKSLLLPDDTIIKLIESDIL